MKQVLLSFLFLILIGLAQPAVGQTVVATTASILTLEDMIQTAYIVPRGGSENNLLLGPHPSTISIEGYSVACIISYWIAPKKIRLIYDVFIVGLETGIVFNNAYKHTSNGTKVGLRFNL
jgi:hypothetical protein